MPFDMKKYPWNEILKKWSYNFDVLLAYWLGS